MGDVKMSGNATDLKGKEYKGMEENNVKDSYRYRYSQLSTR